MALQIEKIKYAGSSKIISALCTKINAVIDAAGSGGGGSITASADATTLTPGSEATASVEQSGDNAMFHFGIPSGIKGDKGDTGATGPQGPKGDKGDKGDAGTTDYNDLSNKPTSLSDFTDDVVSGHYYPLEGGTILNVGYDDDTPALGLMKIYNANGLATYLYCHEHPNEAWDDGAPLPDSDITVHFPRRSGTIVVDGELRRYLPLTGGTLTGALTTQSDTTNDVIESATDGHSRALQIRGRGTASALAYGLLYLGNSTASGTAGNSQGILRIYGSGAAYSNVYSAATSNRNQVLPDKAGTFAMTSDIPTVPTKLSQLTDDVSDTANTANAIVRRDAYGYIYATYLNVSNGAQTPTASSYIGYFNSDGFLRKSTLADIRTITDSQLSSASSFQAPGEIFLKSEGSDPTGLKALIWHHSDSGLIIAPQWIPSSKSYSIRVNALDNNWTFAPGANMSLNLGSPSYKWWNIYATNGTIQTSDRRNKKDILSIEDSIYVQFFNDLKPVSYKMKDGTSGRTHIGFIAQDVEEAMNKNGLSAIDFAGLCIDERHENKYIYNENGELKDIVEINALDEDGNQIYDYSLRYEEFIALNTIAIQRLQRRVEELERRLEEWTK